VKNPSGRRLLARGAGGVVIAGSFEQHYADVNGYWLQTDAVLDGTWHSSVLSRKRHGVWRYRLVDMSFPTRLSDGLFANADYIAGTPESALSLMRKIDTVLFGGSPLNGRVCRAIS